VGFMEKVVNYFFAGVFAFFLFLSFGCIVKVSSCGDYGEEVRFDGKLHVPFLGSCEGEDLSYDFDHNVLNLRVRLRGHSCLCKKEAIISWNGDVHFVSDFNEFFLSGFSWECRSDLDCVHEFSLWHRNAMPCVSREKLIKQNNHKFEWSKGWSGPNLDRKNSEGTFEKDPGEVFEGNLENDHGKGFKSFPDNSIKEQKKEEKGNVMCTQECRQCVVCKCINGKCRSLPVKGCC